MVSVVQSLKAAFPILVKFSVANNEVSFLHALKAKLSMLFTVSDNLTLNNSVQYEKPKLDQFFP